MSGKVKVLIVDDSALVRKALSQLLSSDPGIQLLGAAADPIFAERHLKEEWPDVIVLDLEMPRMDGLTFLRKLMREHPTPVVICSSLAQEGAQTTLDALAAGAVTVVAKPTSGIKEFFEHDAKGLLDSVKAAAGSNLKPLTRPRERIVRRSHAAARPADGSHPGASRVARGLGGSSERIVLIGASTGGTQAIESLLRELPAAAPPIAIVQHMPPKFTGPLAERLNRVCAIDVKEAQSGDRLRPGRALIAQGGRHLVIVRSGAQYHMDVIDSEPVNRHRPSVDVLFDSASALGGGPQFLAMLLTGMGADGAKGLLGLKLTRAHTIAQDESTCVVFGMPREAIRLGAAAQVLPLPSMAGAIMEFASRND